MKLAEAKAEAEARAFGMSEKSMGLVQVSEGEASWVTDLERQEKSLMLMGKSISQQTASLDKIKSGKTKKDDDMDHFEDQMNAALDQPI